MLRKASTLLAILALIALMASSSFAYTASDDWGNNTPDIVTGLKYDDHPGCDTLGELTTNSVIVDYRCINGTATGTQGLGNLTAFEMSASGGRFTIKYTTEGPIPVAGSTDVLGGIQGFNFTVFFQNKSKQNARQIIGDTVDCARYAHMGPYLSGNGEYLSIFYEVTFTEKTWTENIGWGHVDPTTNSNWAFLADDEDGKAYTTCSGNVRVPATFNWPERPTASVSGNTLTLSVPYNFRWVDNQGVGYSYAFASGGDHLTSILPTISGVVDAATTPAIGPVTLPVDSDGDGSPDQVSQGSQGITLNLLLDWAPWAGIDLGLVPNPTGISEIPSVVCPGYSALEYTPGGAKNGTGGTYAPLPKGPNGEDNDTQVNPFFSPGLSSYDSSRLGGTTTNQFLPQNHDGPIECTTSVPAVSRFTGSGGSLTAGF